MRQPRRAYVCYEEKKGSAPQVVHERKFLGPDDPVPSCAQHGKMVPQPNARYLGQRV